MSVLHSPSSPPLSRSFLKFVSSPRNPTFFSKTPLKPPNKQLNVSSCFNPNSLPSTDQEILQSITKFDDNNTTTSLPSVRTYENDLSRLRLIGDVAFEQALTAAAADGGVAADEHIEAGMPTMVVETIFPGPSDERSTISTRLFLPARKVKEKAKNLRSTLPPDMLSSTTSRNILAMTFRQVVLQRLWSFELQLFRPGAERNMEDLENPREEAVAIFTLSSSNDRVLSVLAEAICMYALESTKLDFQEETLGRASKSFFGWIQKPRSIVSKDSSVVIHKISEDELVNNAKIFIQNSDAIEIGSPKAMKRRYQRWTSSTYSKLEKIGGPEFISWTSEYIPAYRLQVDASKLRNVKFEGWKKSEENRWEVLLTHSQMVELADTLDMYYEDVYTLPNKQLSCGVVADFTKLSKNKSSTSLWKKLVISLVGGLFVVSISMLLQAYQSHLYGSRKSATKHLTIPSAETEQYQVQVLDTSELESLCITIVKKIKAAVGWPGDIETDTKLGAWTGELPSYLRELYNKDLHEKDSSTREYVHTISTGGYPPDEVNTDMKTSVQDIASYQVVLSKEGKVVGFQPTSRVAINHWASNALAKELYNGRELTPGLIEPGLKIPCPEEIILIELLMSVNPESWFALARPLRE